MLNTFFRLMSCTRKRQVFTSWIAGRGVWKVLQIIWFLRKKWLNVKPLPIYNNWPMHYECWIKKKRSLLANICNFCYFCYLRSALLKVNDILIVHIFIVFLYYHLYHHHLIWIISVGQWGQVQQLNSSGMVYFYPYCFG